MQRGIYVAGLREEIVASPEQVLDLMEFGECNYLYHSSYVFFFKCLSSALLVLPDWLTSLFSTF